MAGEGLLARFERWMRSAHFSDRTVDKRLRMAERVLERWPRPGEASAAALTEWLGECAQEARCRTGREWSSATAASYHSDVRAFFSWLAEVEVIGEDPTASKVFKRPKVNDGLPKPLSPAEERRALMAAHGNVRAWLLLALREGLRAHEIAKVRGEDVTEEFVYVRGKGRTEAHIPTHADVWALAQEYPRSGWWFPSPAHDGHVSGDSVTIMVGRHFRKVGIPTGSIHRARHSYGTTLLRRGANMRQVQTLMRHRSPATTALYTAVDEDEMRAAINLLGDAG